MNVQSSKLQPSRVEEVGARSGGGAGLTSGYMSGFGNSFETEALPGTLQDDYLDCWSGLSKRFDPTRRAPG